MQGTPGVEAAYYTYDGRGNQVAREVLGGHTTYFDYNSRDLITRIVSTDPSFTMPNTFDYNALGQRIRKTDSTGTTYYVWDGIRITHEHDGSGAVSRRYTYGHADIVGVADLLDVYDPSASAHYWYHFDQVGGVRVLTDTSGASAKIYEFSPYGRTVTESGSAPNDFVLPTNSVALPDLLCSRAGYCRQYSVEAGRWATRDILRARNRYEFVLTNPVRIVDPDNRAPNVRLRCYELQSIWHSQLAHWAAVLQRTQRHLEARYREWPQLDSYGAGDPDRPHAQPTATQLHVATRVMDIRRLVTVLRMMLAMERGRGLQLRGEVEAGSEYHGCLLRMIRALSWLLPTSCAEITAAMCRGLPGDPGRAYGFVRHFRDPGVLPSCPLTRDEATRGGWQRDPDISVRRYHPAADTCYRKRLPPSDYGQQCCYDCNGDLVTHGPGAGTPDLYSTAGGLLLGGLRLGRHLRMDVEVADALGGWRAWGRIHELGWAPMIPPGARENWGAYSPKTGQLTR